MLIRDDDDSSTIGLGMLAHESSDQLLGWTYYRLDWTRMDQTLILYYNMGFQLKTNWQCACTNSYLYTSQDFLFFPM